MATKKTTTKKKTAKKTAVKKTAVKKTAAEKATVEKTAVDKAAVKKTAVKKTAAKRAAKKTSKQIRVTLVRSPIGFQPRHRECVRGLGLKRMHHSVVLEDTPSIRGMVNKINYMVRVEEA